MFGEKQTFTCPKCASKSQIYSMFSIFKTQCIKCRGVAQDTLNNYRDLALSGQLNFQQTTNDLQKYLQQGSINQTEYDFLLSLLPKFSKKNCPPQKSCAHDAAHYLYSQGFSELKAVEGYYARMIEGMCRCECGLVIRAKEMRKWAASKGQQVNAVTANGIYLVYQERSSDGQGHVYAVIDGVVRGNSLGDKWKAWDIQQFYKLK